MGQDRPRQISRTKYSKSAARSMMEKKLGMRLAGSDDNIAPFLIPE